MPKGGPMTTLQVELGIDFLSPSWLIPKSFPARVGEFVASFDGQPYTPQGVPTIGDVSALVYIVAPNDVRPDQTGFLGREWSKRAGGVKVRSVTIVPGVPTPAAQRDALAREGIFAKAVGAVGSVVGDAGKALAVPLTVALIAVGAYAVYRMTGRKG